MVTFTVQELAEEFQSVDRPLGIILDDAVVVQAAVSAARKYAGYAYIQSLLPVPPTVTPDPTPPSREELSFLDTPIFPPIYGYPLYPLQPAPIVAGTPIAPVDWVNAETVIAQSEWAVIRPLFLLYVEREQSIQLEASRNLGVDVFGRSTSEVDSDIERYEERLPGLAFCEPVISV